MNLQLFITQIKQSIKLSLPIILSELTGSIGGFVGTVMLAHVNEDSLAALALVNTSFITLIASCWGVIMSVSVLVSHAYGAKEFEKIDKIVGQGFWLAAILSVPFILLLVNASPFFLALGQDPKTVALAQSYFNPVSLSIPPVLCAGVIQQYILAFKRSRVVLACTALGVLISVPINYVLIFGKLGFPALGIVGIGWSTVVIHCFMLIFMGAYALFDKEFRPYRIFSNIFRVDWKHLAELFQLGWPIGAMLWVEIFGLFAAVVLCGWLGIESLAAYQIVLQCMITSIMVPWGMGQGAAVLVAHAKGENNIQKVKEMGHVNIALVVSVCFIIALIFWLLQQPIVGLFLNLHENANIDIIQMILPMLTILGWTILFDGMRIVVSGALRGLKDTRITLIVGFISFWIVGLPIGYLLAFHFHDGPRGLWIGDLLGVIIGLLILVFRWRYLLKSYEKSITI